MRHRWLLLALSCGGCDAPTVVKTEEAAAVAPVVVPAVALDSADALAKAGYEVASSPAGMFTAAWRPVAGAVPVNELFEIELLLFDGREEGGRLGPPLGGAKVQVSAWMPEHMHGMSRRPQTAESAPGRYLVRGMLLHMEGSWQLFVDVMAGSRSERAEFALDVKGGAPLAVDGFTPDEVRAFLKLSPLPAPPADPTNRCADDPRAARLGQYLFFDPRFSASGKVACATCHQPALGFADGKHVGDAGFEGAKPLERHTPSLYNVAFNRWWFWDGRSDSLWSQPLRPLEEPREHATTRLEVAHALHADPALARAYGAIFGALPELADAQRFPPKGKPGDATFDAMAPADRLAVDRVFANFGKAVAAYERRLVARAAPFDEFVAGVRTGDVERQRALSPAAREGLRLFVGAARCVRCHSGATFSDREFHDNRVPTLTGEPRRDAGRHDGIPKVQADPFNGTGEFSDAREGAAQDKLRFLLRTGDSWSEFKTPTLRNVALTAPYMHQGQFATLDEVLAYYNTLERAVPSHSPERTLQPLNLSADQLAALREFLGSLTDARLDPELLRPPPTPSLP
jgi:cytochrome c peroxidase